MKRIVNTSSKLFCIALFLLVRSVAAADIEVMTQNQYFGTDFTPLISASTAEEFNGVLVNLLKQMAASNATARLEAQAKLITERAPDVVGLQEVSLIGCSDPFATGACADPAIKGAFVDHLAVTLAALNGAYQAAATVINLNVPGIPFDLYGTGVPALLIFVDRDVILTRAGLVASVVDYSSACTKPILQDGCNYFYAAGPVTTPYGDFYFDRGYVGVDITVAGKDYRIVNTHLEVKDPPTPPILQAVQAQELISTLAATTPPDRSLVVMGDTNSSPVDPPGGPYSQFLQSGYTDAWTLRPGELPGFTCCQLGDLSNHNSLMYERVDLILSLDALAGAKKPRVLGDVVSSKTPPHGQGLWPSDHGAVAATLVFD